MADKAARMREKARARVLVVDDHAIVRRGLVQMINSEPGLSVCGQASGPNEALTLARRQPFDIAVIDLSYDEISGIDLIRSLRVYAPSVRILVLSMLEESYYAERCIRVGAMGFVMKQAEPDCLITGMKTVLQGQIFLSPNMRSQLLRSALTGERPSMTSLVETLTDRELEVFELLGRGLSPRQIAHRLHRSVKTIESHRSRVREKLRLENHAEVLQHAIRWYELGAKTGGPNGRSNSASTPREA